MKKSKIYFSDKSFSTKNNPGLDIAVSRTLLSGVSANQYPSILRVYRGIEQIAFGPADVRNKGYNAAVSYAKQQKFSTVNRLTGGHAVTFHSGTLVFAWMFNWRLWNNFIFSNNKNTISCSRYYDTCNH